MPATSIDTFFACSLMVILVLSAMVGLSKVLYPYLNEPLNGNDVERYQQLTKYLLLNAGTPQNWGCIPKVVPSSFGLAAVNPFQPYELDIDKVSRLNNENVYFITYPQLLESLGIGDVALRIEFKTIFDLSISLMSNLEGEKETTYNFDMFTKKSGLPVQAELHCYVVAKNYVDSASSSTSSTGYGSVSVTIPNSANGTALLVTIAKAKTNPQTAAFNVYPFSHNSTSPTFNETFTRLSPLNYVLNVSFLYPNEEVLTAQMFTYNYSLNLTQIASGGQSAEYSIPRLLDISPMILVITGINGSSYFAESVSYPQLPIEMGADFSESIVRSGIISFAYTVTINSAFYKCTIKCGGPT